MFEVRSRYTSVIPNNKFDKRDQIFNSIRVKNVQIQVALRVMKIFFLEY